jgi:hypothetical protein
MWVALNDARGWINDYPSPPPPIFIQAFPPMPKKPIKLIERSESLSII